jgi:hypothetical protein
VRHENWYCQLLPDSLSKQSNAQTIYCTPDLPLLGERAKPVALENRLERAAGC